MEGENCDHGRKEIRRRAVKNGALHVVEQCLVCGACVRNLPKAEYLGRFNPARLPEWDEEIGKGYWARRREEWERTYRAKREAESAEWWAWYNAYLDSPQWRALRVKVLRRDQFTCLGCGRPNSATQVHHLTYKRVGREMLFDLVSVCDDCHRKIHAADAGGESWR